MTHLFENINYKQVIFGSLQRNMPVPWRCMLKSKACWAAGIANVGHAWGFYTLLTELPTFMDNILHFNMKQVGLFKSKQIIFFVIMFESLQNSFVSALPYLAMWLFSILCSTVADILISKQIFRVTTVRKIFNSLGRLN